VPKGKKLTKRYKFTHKELEVVSKDKSLAKRYRFSNEKIKSK
jgi:hypothetical protein